MTDRFLVRMIAGGLLAVVVICVAAIALVQLSDQRLTIVGGIGTTALGALTAFLVSTRSGAGDPPQEVQVVNQPDAPVPVDAGP